MKTDHGITKGYPFEGIISQERFKIRPNIIYDRKDKNKTKLWMNKGEYPEYKPATWLQNKIAGKLIDFLEFRIFDYAEALLVAEAQIQHMQEEQPFLPEDFGFVKTVGPKEVFDDPTKIYTSKYDENISLFRNDEEECEWHMLTRSNGAFTDTKLQLPNHRIAYAAFLALGVKVESGEVEAEVEREGQELKEYMAIYRFPSPEMRSDEGIDLEGECKAVEINLKAYDDEDARSKAKFIFETRNLGISDPIKFNEVSVRKLN